MKTKMGKKTTNVWYYNSISNIFVFKDFIDSLPNSRIWEIEYTYQAGSWCSLNLVLHSVYLLKEASISPDAAQGIKAAHFSFILKMDLAEVEWSSTSQWF